MYNLLEKNVIALLSKIGINKINKLLPDYKLYFYNLFMIRKILKTSKNLKLKYTFLSTNIDASKDYYKVL